MPAVKPLRRRHQRVISTILLVAACGIAARCQDSDSSDRSHRAPMPEYLQEFFLSDAVRCQEKGEVQLTLATESRHPAGANVALHVEYGLTDRLQAGLEVPYGITASRDEVEIIPRWSSISAGFVYEFIRSNRPITLSAGMTFELPLSSRGELGFAPAILLARSFRKLQIHASVLSEIEQWKPSVDYNVATVHPIKHVWFPTFEFNGRRQNARNAFYLTPGLYRHSKHRSEVGIGIPVGIGGVAGSLGVVAKMNWEVGGSGEGRSTGQPHLPEVTPLP